MSSAKRWGYQDNEKLLNLFKSGQVTTTGLTSKYISTVREKHFPERISKNFLPLFRRRAREFDLDKSLAGGRQQSGKCNTLFECDFSYQ